MRFLIFIAWLSFAITAFGQKSVEAFRTDASIKMDGELDEDIWQKAPEATGFTQLEPNPGNPASHPSKVMVLYDDGALYVGAMLYDPNPDSILKELTLRDNVENDDEFGVLLNPYNDGNTGTGYSVTAAGVQLDGRFSNDGSDLNYDLVWESAVSIHDSGWSVEFRIPYSAIRFPKKEIQTWSINFMRRIRRYRQESWWNEVKPDEAGIMTQMGRLTGLKNITPPLRLSVTPYVSGYLDFYSDPVSKTTASDYRMNGGMDLKYGINEAFTLDMTLIPDFGQVEFDEQVLNLSPFEVRFEERRQFFTEGVELFNRGEIFYSRRVGGDPFYANELNERIGENEIILNNPGRSQLINATKISGRNDNNLGIGIFNAVEDRAFATVENEQGEQREIQTNPLTNYNIIVLDQSLANNSYVSLINTNVWREGTAPEANVTATEFEVRNKNNRYSVRGGANLSQHYSDEFNDPKLGLQYSLDVGKISGNFQFNYWYYVTDDKYDPNDLGFLFNNNERTTGVEFSYNIYEPRGNILRNYNTLGFQYQRLYNPNAFMNYGIWYNNLVTFSNFLTIGGTISSYPSGLNDYFEPRTPGFFYHVPANYHIDAFYSPDYRKNLAFDVRAGLTAYEEPGRLQFNYNLAPRIRLSDQLFIIYDWKHSFYRNNIGFATKLDDQIIFGKRNQETVEQSINGRFIFNNKMGLRLKLRHYWSKVKYLNYYELQKDGTVMDIPYDGLNGSNQSKHNTNYNALTMDLGFTWRFAPGSDMSVVWKSSIFQLGNDLPRDYFDDLSLLTNNPHYNGISIKLLYYLDYLMVKNALHGSS